MFRTRGNVAALLLLVSMFAFAFTVNTASATIVGEGSQLMQITDGLGDIVLPEDPEPTPNVPDDKDGPNFPEPTPPGPDDKDGPNFPEPTPPGPDDVEQPDFQTPVPDPEIPNDDPGAGDGTGSQDDASDTVVQLPKTGTGARAHNELLTVGILLGIAVAIASTALLSTGDQRRSM
jgi:hypothetical protein